MTTTAAPGWGRSYISAVSVAEVASDRTGVQETLNRYAFALDQHDLAALRRVEEQWRIATLFLGMDNDQP